MPRRQRSSEDEYGSDGSFSPEDSIFDMDIEASDAETEITEVDPLPNADGQVDVAGLEEFVADLADADADHIDIDTVHSSEYYRRIVEEVDNSDSDAQDYSPGTEILLSGFEDHWQRFCKENEFADPHRQLESISLGILRGKGGRKIKGIKTNSALGTYWKVFRLVYERAMTVKLDPKINRQMHKALRKLPKVKELSNKKRVNRCMIINDLKEQIEKTRVGEILGRMYTTICYRLRYNAGNELDDSPHAGDAIRNLALDHDGPVPFQKHYLGRQVRLDTWAIIRGQTPQQAMLKQACSIGHANSKQRPIDLTPQQVVSVNTNPRIKELAREVERLPHRSKERQKAGRALKNEKQRLKRALMERIKDVWTDEQAVEDIHRQLQGLEFSQPMDVDSAACAPQRPAQKRLVASLTAPIDDTLEEYYQRRGSLIDAIVAHCSVVEGRAICRTNGSTAKKPVQIDIS